METCTDEDKKSLYRAKRMQYANERSMLFAEHRIEGYRDEKEGFDLQQLLMHVMELLFARALDNRVDLRLSIEPSFPKEVIGERNKFELMLATLLDYLVEYSVDEEVGLSAMMKNAIENGFNLCFDLDSTADNQNINLELITALMARPWERELCPFVLSRSIVEWIKGSIEVVHIEGKHVRLHIEVPFNAFDKSYALVTIPTLVPRYVQTSKRTFCWIADPEKLARVLAQTAEEETKRGQSGGKEAERNWKKAEQLIREKLQSRKPTNVPMTPGLYSSMRPLKARPIINMDNQGKGMLDGGIFGKIVKSDKKSAAAEKTEDQTEAPAEKKPVVEGKAKQKRPQAREAAAKKRSSDTNVGRGGSVSPVPAFRETEMFE